MASNVIAPRPSASKHGGDLRLLQHGLRDRVRQRLRRLDQAEQREDDQEVDEVVGGEDARRDHVAAFGRLRAEPAEPEAHQHEHPEELLVERPVGRRLHPRGVEPRQEGEHQDRAEHRDHARELVRDRAQDRVERQVVPFGHDVRRRHARIGRDVVVGVAEIVRHVEHEPGEEQAEHRHHEAVLHGRVRRERHGVLPDHRPDVRRTKETRAANSGSVFLTKPAQLYAVGKPDWKRCARRRPPHVAW